MSHMFCHIVVALAGVRQFCVHERQLRLEYGCREDSASRDGQVVADMKYLRTHVKQQSGMLNEKIVSPCNNNMLTIEGSASESCPSRGACGEAERYASHAKMTMMRQDYAVAACIGPSGSDLSKRVSQEAAQMTPVMPVVGVSGTATSLSNKVHPWYK
eukprot:2036303-Amphidinium_carterae.1